LSIEKQTLLFLFEGASEREIMPKARVSLLDAAVGRAECSFRKENWRTYWI
jgi:hypothetical protein